MPLIVVTGLPCSGKTHRAAQIIAQFESRISASDSSSSTRRCSVLRIPSNHARLDNDLFKQIDQKNGTDNKSNILSGDHDLRNAIYNSAAAEKTARAEEFSAVKRAISKDVIVVADGLNYLKSFRYQLWCEAKASGTRCCTVHVAATEEEVDEWNEERLKTWGWDQGHEGIGPATSSERTVGIDEEAAASGPMVPESHTAIYGDRPRNDAATRSRSSSIDYIDSEDPRPTRGGEEDRMTLKSLYIRDEPEDTLDSTTNTGTAQLPITARARSSSSDPFSTIPLPSVPPPLPTSSPPYTPSTLTSLTMRYEPPSPFSRWDTPLFTIPTTDPHPPYDQIWSAIFPEPIKHLSKKARAQIENHAKQGANGADDRTGQAGEGEGEKERDKVKPHAATVLPPAPSANALQTLESATQDVVTALLAAVRKRREAGPKQTEDHDQDNNDDNNDDGDEEEDEEQHVLHLSIPSHHPLATGQSPPIHSPPTLTLTLTIPPSKQPTLSQPTLQRARRRYLALQRGAIAHGQGYLGNGRMEAVEGFVRFLEGEFADG